MDGDDSVAESGKLIDRLASDSELRERWSAYCLIGDTIRGQSSCSPEFSARVMGALDDELTVLAPPRRAPAKSRQSGVFDRVLPIAASAMGVAAVAWIALSLNASPTPPKLSAQPLASVDRGSALVERVAVGVAPTDSHHEYVFIHQASSGNGRIPGVAPYVRSVSEVQQGAAR